MSSYVHLYQEMLLLALCEEKGSPISGAWTDNAVSGALLAELLLEKRIQLVDKKMVELVDRTPLGDELLDDCLATIEARKKPRSLSAWMSSACGLKKVRQRAAASLVERGILEAETKQVLLIFERKIYPERNPEPERELTERLRNAVLKDDAEILPRTLIALSLAHRTGLLQTVFDKRERKRHKQRIEDVISGDAAGAAAKEAIDAAIAMMVITTCIIPTVIS